MPNSGKFTRRTLVEDIRDILRKYPCDSQIFKEIIQNGEDAGASNITFVYDENSYEEEKFSIPGLKDYQGPSLYAYNNAVFTEKDWEGISSLGISNKEKQALKVGKFGLGFKSVFHLTDFPMVLSGTKFIFLDPMVFTLSSEVLVFDFQNDEDRSIFQNFADFELFKRLFQVKETGVNGTLFRFPLRQKKSDLSEFCCSNGQLNDLIKSLKDDGYLSLLFLKKVKRIELCRIQKGSNKKEVEYSVALTEDCIKRYDRSKTQFVDSIQKQLLSHSYSEVTNNYEVSIIEKEINRPEVNYHYFVSEYYGAASSDFDDLKSLNLLPLVTVAYPQNVNNLGDVGGHIFCVLPLPMWQKSITGLPVHVNGFFALSEDRRDLKWPTDPKNINKDKQVLWNIFLITKLLPQAYSNLMKYVIQVCSSSDAVYNCWPNKDVVDKRWQQLLDPFFKRISQLKCFYCSFSKEWLQPSDCYIIKPNLFSSEEQNLCVKGFLEMCGVKVSVVPNHVQSYFTNLKLISKSLVQTTVKSKINVYKSCKSSDMLQILEFILVDVSDADQLLGLPMLPMHDGRLGSLNYKSSNISSSICIATDNHPLEIFPSYQNFINQQLFQKNKALMKIFQAIAKTGRFNITVIESCQEAIIVIKALCVQNKSCFENLVINDFYHNWYKSLWSYKKRHRLNLQVFEGMPMLLTIQQKKISLCLLTKNDTNVIVESFEKSVLTPAMKLFLDKCCVPLLYAEDLDQLDIFELCSNNFVMKPTNQGILISLINHHQQLKIDVLSCVSDAPNEVRKEIRTGVEKHLQNHSLLDESTKVFVTKLKIFEALHPQHPQDSYVCLDQSSYIINKIHFFTLMSCLGNFIDSALISRSIFSSLNLSQLSYSEVVILLSNNYQMFSSDQQHQLNEFLLDSLGEFEPSTDALNLLKNLILVESDGKFIKPSSLFEKTSDLEKMFFGEVHRFPNNRYNIAALKKLGLKLKTDLSSNDIAQSIHSIDKINFKTEDFSKIINKVKIILQTRNFNMSNYFNLKWIPIKQKCSGSYPISLQWFGTKKYLVEPVNVYLDLYECLIGSVAFIIHPSLSELYAKFILNKNPSLNFIIQHLKNIEISYDDEEKGLYKQNIQSVYNDLGRFNVNDVATSFKDLQMKIWTGSCFLDINKVLYKNIPLKYDVSPYYNQVKTEIPDVIEKYMMTLDYFPKNEIDVYLSVLKQIKEKHDTTDKDTSFDLELSIKLVKFIALNFSAIPTSSHVFVPIQSRRLCLVLLSECYYKSSDTGASNNTSTYNLLHELFSEDDAEMLNLPNLVSVLLTSNESFSCFQSWGQHEPLTTKLNRILKVYNDGFAIAKEFVQNADDAGAKVVKFLYDKRLNKEMKNNLFDSGMKHWQGPALWIYNSAEFTEQDFVNITKLNAGTKEFDTSKIGTFGLGFNSVYHLTDLPSILSGNTLVVFDPHTEYLGRAIHDKRQPGIKIALNGNSNCLQFSNQFKVFHGIFDCHLDFDSGDVQTFKGTLFRIPLRSGETASMSKISQLVYSENEMKLLYQKIEERLKHLLLFTENVSEFGLFEISDNINKVSTISTVKKDIEVLHRFGVTNEISVMKLGTHMLQNNQSFKNVDIQLKVTIDSVVKKNTEKNVFLVSSCVGGENSYAYARKNKGNNSCGSIAVEITDHQENKFVENVDGDIFCFLPLPIKSGLPVHVNGFFSLSSDRKHLLETTHDEKSYGKKDWNDILAEDLSAAYINLLVQLKKLNSSYTLIKWAKIIPHSGEKNHSMRSLTRSFSKKLIENNLELFPSDVNYQWIAWKCLRFLSNDIPSNIRLEVLAFMNWSYSLIPDRLYAVDMPEHVLNLFLECGFNLEANKLIVKEFITLFLSNLGSPLLDVGLRNKITMFLINNFIDYVYNCRCLPTKPNGNLKMSSECVAVGCKVASLFYIEDEVFVIDQFEPFLYKFKDINSHNLSWPMILLCANSISNMSDYHKTVKRSKLLLEQMESAENSECPENIKNELLKTKFLPSFGRPDLWPFYNHFGELHKIEAPCNSFGKQYLSLASVTKPIFKFHIKKPLISFLGLNKIPSFETVKQQLIDLNSCSKITSVNETLQTVLNDIYDYFNKNESSTELKELKGLRIAYSENLELVLPSLTYVNFPTDISPYIFQLSKNIVSNDNRKNLMIKLGVKLQPDIEDMLNILSKIKEDYNMDSLTNHLLKAIVQFIIPELMNFKDSIISENLYLPDTNGLLRKSAELYFKDNFWIPDKPGINYCHGDIPLSYCAAIGIKPARHKHFSMMSKGISYKQFGQHEKLSVRLGKILKGYRNDQDILNELLQNADDAGATEVIFLLDTRSHGTEKIFYDEWSDLQGPALLVCNDAIFKQSDLDGIQNLGEGTKSLNALQTGKYGVGFNAVYQITDCPMLLTPIAEGGDVFCVFDPNLKYVMDASESFPGTMIEDAREVIETYSDVKNALLIDEFDSKGKTLFRLPLRNEKMSNASKIIKTVVDVNYIKDLFLKFEKYSSSVMLFLKSVCKLSFKIIEDNTTKEGKSVTFIAQHYKTKLKKVTNFLKAEKDFANKLGNVTAIMNFKEQLNKFVCVTHLINNKFHTSHHWNIIEQVGFSSMDKVPPQILELIEKNELCLVPKGGVAISINKKCDTCKSKKEDLCNTYANSGLVFCSLPLPMSTNLPVFINGNFVLEYETRRCLSLSEPDSVEFIWNKTIIRHCIVPCYLEYITHQASKLSKYFDDLEKQSFKIKQFYNMFPKPDNDKYSNFVKQYFFQTIFEDNLSVLLVLNENKFDCVSSKEFLVYEIDKDFDSLPTRPQLLLMLQQLFIPCDLLPEHIQTGFSDVQSPLKICTPGNIRKLLRELAFRILPKSCEHWNVEKTKFKEKQNLKMILKYCLTKEIVSNKQKESLFKKSTDIEYLYMVSYQQGWMIKEENHVPSIELNGLPLCLCADGSVTCFSEENPKFLSKYSVLFTEFASKFIDSSFVNVLFNDYKNSKCFKEFTVIDFVNFLPNVLSKEKFFDVITEINLEDNKKILGKDFNWFKNAWRFLSEIKNDGTANWLHSDLKPWSLLIVKSGDKSFIVPLGKSKNVLQLQNVHRSFEELAQILRKCFGVFESDFIEDIFLKSKSSDNINEFLYSLDLAETLFGNINEPLHLVNALTFSFSYEKWYNYTKKEAILVLKHLQNCLHLPKFNLYNYGFMRPSVEDSLKKLPLFLSIEDNFVSLKTKWLVLVTESVLFDGLADLLKGITFLKYIDEVIKELYISLGCVCIKRIEFYETYVISYFNQMNECSKDKHIDFIQRFFINKEFGYGQWITLLKSVKFVKNCNGERMFCSQLYDPTNSLFIQILKKDKFPMPKINGGWTSIENRNWLNFLKANGLITNMTEDIFIHLAKENEELEDIEKFNDVSKELIEYLNNMFTIEFYEKIKRIKFISSLKMDAFRESLCPSVNSACKKICMEGSALHESQDLVWTNKTVLPKYLGLNLTSNLKKYNLDQYKPDDVVNHVQNVLNSTRFIKKNKTQMLIPSDIVDLFSIILKHIYSYLDSLQNSHINSKVKDMSIVFVLRNTSLDVPHKALLSEEGNIPPYLCPVDVSLFQYFDFFRKIGCHSIPSSVMYMQVLNSLKEETNENMLHPNDIKIASSAMRYLCDMLQRDSLLPAGSKLYLPTYKFDSKEKNSIHLTLSSNIITMSDLCYAERLKNFQEPILFSDKNDKIEPGTSDILMKHLTAEIQPKHIRDVLNEEIISEINPIPIPTGHISEDIKKRLKASEFLLALQRLIMHHHRSGSIDINMKSTIETLTKILQHTNVVVVAKIETKLRFLPKDTLIDGSNSVSNVFLCKSKYGGNLYLTSVLEEKDLDKIYTYLTNHLVNYLDLSFKEATIPILFFQIFRIPLHSLSTTLNEYNIYHDSNISFLNHGQLPLPGDKVPLELHSLLSNEYFEFELDDYAALDVGSGDDREFVYVLIKSKPSGCFKDINSMYDVQESPDGMPIKRRSFLLYGFNRNANPGMRKRIDSKSVAVFSGAENLDEDLNDFEENLGDVEEICCLMKKELEDLAVLSQEDKKKVIRRLILRWHPDKHALKNKDKATKIFQFVQKFINPTDEGMSNNFNKWSSQASRDRNHFNNYFKTFFKSEYFKSHQGSQSNSHQGSQSNSNQGSHSNSNQGSQSNSHQSFHSNSHQGSQSSSNQSNHSWVPPSFQKTNPQPSEAKRWLRQAKFDLDCAEKEIFFEWKCFKSHQAAEKSLKSAQYLVDFKTIKSCSLIDNAVGLDTDLKNWATDLECLIGSSYKSRYPDQWKFPRIPHESYSSDEADKAIKIARNIYQNVLQKLDKQADY